MGGSYFFFIKPLFKKNIEFLKIFKTCILPYKFEINKKNNNLQLVNSNTNWYKLYFYLQFVLFFK